jgi:preprotein translocase subunit SecD
MRLLARVIVACLLLLQPVLAADIELAVASAKATFDPISAQPSIEVTLTPEAAKAFGELTTKNVGNVIELRVDGELLTSPTVRSPILGGTLVITGEMSQADAKDIAARLAEDGARIVLTPIPY